MKTYIYIYSISLSMIFMLVFNFQGYAQYPPQDKNWQLNTARSDEFNSNSLNTNLWINRNCDYCRGPVLYRPSSVTVSGGWIKITASKNSIGQIVSGELISSDKYSYGFFEVSAIVPKGKGCYASLWMFSSKYLQDKIFDYYHEIDIYEATGCRSKDANNYTMGVHAKNLENPLKFKKYYHWENNNLPDLSVAEHSYSVEWLPGVARFYYDNKLMYEVFDNYAVPSHPMGYIIGFSVSDEDEYNCHPDGTTIFPIDFKLNWFRYYELKKDCNTSLVEIPSFNNFYYAVKKSITLGEATIVPQNADITLRATDFFDLKPGFEVPLGTDMKFFPTPCY